MPFAIFSRRAIPRVASYGPWLTAALLASAAACGGSEPPNPGAAGGTGTGTGVAGASAGFGGAAAGAVGSAGAAGNTVGSGGAGASGGGTTTTGGSAGAAGAQAGGGANGGTAGGSAGGAGGTAVYLPKFILGADVTITMEDEYWDANYTDAGQTKSLEQILKAHGFNFIRIDTFVNPGAPGGFAADKEEDFRDLAHTITLAKRVKAIGMGFLLDLHYSDTWTNPGAQGTPAAWAGLSISALETKVYEYTKDAVTQLKNASAMPDIVQVGNEITAGMLWDLGRASGSDFANLATLLKAGIRGVREVNPDIRVMLHIEKCHNLETSKWWLDGVLGAGVQFDILGQSCYAAAPNGVAGYQGTPEQWKTTFAALAADYPNLKFIIAEYSAQQRAANDTMFNLPNGRGLGTFNWDPTRSYDTHPNHPLFTTNGAWNRFVAIPEMMALYDKMATDYGLR
ncbi:MAG: galA [Polyangiaceae bacterium]|nr:galA [Polyangiaceae bacterium]